MRRRPGLSRRRPGNGAADEQRLLSRGRISRALQGNGCAANFAKKLLFFHCGTAGSSATCEAN